MNEFHAVVFAGLFNQTQDAIEILEEVYHLYPIEVLKVVVNGSLHDPEFDATSLLPTGVSFTDPRFFSDSASNVSSSSRVRSLVAMQAMPTIFTSTCGIFEAFTVMSALLSLCVVHRKNPSNTIVT